MNLGSTMVEVRARLAAARAGAVWFGADTLSRLAVRYQMRHIRRHHRRPFHRVDAPQSVATQRVRDEFTALERVALVINARVGTFSFLIAVEAIYSSWIVWNIAPFLHPHFDPAPTFLLLLFLSNWVQLTLMPILLIATNLLARHAEYRAEEEYERSARIERAVTSVEGRIIAIEETVKALPIGAATEVIQTIVAQVQETREAVRQIALAQTTQTSSTQGSVRRTTTRQKKAATNVDHADAERVSTSQSA